MATSTVKYTVQSTRPDVQVNKSGTPVRGYVLSVYLSEWDETHDIFVDQLDPKVAQKAIDKLIENRQAISSLGQ